MSYKEKTKKALKFTEDELYIQLSNSGVTVKGDSKFVYPRKAYKFGQFDFKKGTPQSGKYRVEVFLKYNLKRICEIWNEQIRDNIEDAETVAIVLTGLFIESGLPIEAAIAIAVLLIRRGLNKLCDEY